ncbi:hypothetical protein P4U90_04995 [Cytobacillus kochii]|uniref:hypothetical protein n=1 Tax=Cytobacillus kochii TaxID=859143 RepID=UPI0012FDED57|nr:hypothetical protein [Cytobacillus kochii]MDQ0184376.1 hypothetical protein [Cytobacillus kochii]MEA1852452.1 hypothetical protein [Cytobacillus sp. OWB-43]MED1604674.1 hypothetical protein [Cytobacillus kochii]
MIVWIFLFWPINQSMESLIKHIVESGMKRAESTLIKRGNSTVKETELVQIKKELDGL